VRAPQEGIHVSTTPRDAVIVIEQKAVDRAYDCYEARHAEMSSSSAATASASRAS
jgi:hypothetical protein